MTTEITGRPPNEAEQFWIDAGKKITPEKLDKAVERLDAHGKFLFSIVSVIGTLLTGFGIFSPSGMNVLRNKWILVPIAGACLSLALAMMGITPWVQKLRLWDIHSISHYYDTIIRKRGLWILSGSVVFSLSLISVAIVTAYSVKPVPIVPAISIGLAGIGEKTTLKAKVELQELPRSGTAETEISGYTKEEPVPQQTLLFKEITHADQSGKITVQAEIDQVQKYGRFVITSRVKAGSELLCERKLEMTR